MENKRIEMFAHRKYCDLEMLHLLSLIEQKTCKHGIFEQKFFASKTAKHNVERLNFNFVSSASSFSPASSPTPFHLFVCCFFLSQNLLEEFDRFRIQIIEIRQLGKALQPSADPWVFGGVDGCVYFHCSYGGCTTVIGHRNAISDQIIVLLQEFLQRVVGGVQRIDLWLGHLGRPTKNGDVSIARCWIQDTRVKVQTLVDAGA